MRRLLNAEKLEILRNIRDRWSEHEADNPRSSDWAGDNDYSACVLLANRYAALHNTFKGLHCPMEYDGDLLVAAAITLSADAADGGMVDFNRDAAARRYEEGRGISNL